MQLRLSDATIPLVGMLKLSIRIQPRMSLLDELVACSVDAEVSRVEYGNAPSRGERFAVVGRAAKLAQQRRPADVVAMVAKDVEYWVPNAAEEPNDRGKVGQCRCF